MTIIKALEHSKSSLDAWSGVKCFFLGPFPSLYHRGIASVYVITANDLRSGVW
jgi:hypothetical protein